MNPLAKPQPDLLRDVEAFYRRYVTFPEADYPFVLALWTMMTFVWPHFDAIPYLVITSETKRSGKTRLSELLSFVASVPLNMAGMTAAAVYNSIKDLNPTMFIDEAETLSGESAEVMRSVLNVGYRKGQTIPRVYRGKVVQWPVYCPKAFILIGDVYDTLRDRSIVVIMRRGAPADRFLYETAKIDGDDLRQRAADIMFAVKKDVVAAYEASPGLPFLQDRDEEIWSPLFAIASILCPDRLDQLTRAAVDIATMKTAPKRKYTELELGEAEQEATNAEYAERLLADMLTVMGHHKVIYSADALDKLHALPTGPWRKFRGQGLTAYDMGHLLERFQGVKPRLIRTGSSKKAGSRVARGYRREAIEAALAQLKHPA